MATMKSAPKTSKVDTELPPPRLSLPLLAPQATILGLVAVDRLELVGDEVGEDGPRARVAHEFLGPHPSDRTCSPASVRADEDVIVPVERDRPASSCCRRAPLAFAVRALPDSLDVHRGGAGAEEENDEDDGKGDKPATEPAARHRLSMPNRSSSVPRRTAHPAPLLPNEVDQPVRHPHSGGRCETPEGNLDSQAVRLGHLASPREV